MSIRLMSEADIPDGMRLKDQAGWNQVAADWLRFLALAEGGCFVCVHAGEVIGSVTTCRFGPIGWVAMLLVAQSHRGNGIGTSRMRRALQFLEEAGVRSVRLDATPAGRPLYQALGFRVDFPLWRFAGVARGMRLDRGICTGQPGDRPEAAELDRLVTGTDRQKLIDRLVDDNPGRFVLARPVGGPVQGFAIWRPGSSADQVGPCIADRETGRALLDGVAATLGAGPMIIDVPAGHEAAVAWAASRGLQASRPLWRMTRGESVAEDLGRIWASSGPEMG